MTSISHHIICKNLKKEEVISLATDTVNGLACLASSTKAIELIYNLKNRPIDKPLAILVSSLNMAKRYISITPIIKDLLLDPLYSFTIISRINNYADLSPKINQINNNIALRIPKHALLLNIINELSVPIAATSTNQTGENILTTPEEIHKTFGDKVKIYQNTENTTNIPSAIIDCTSNDIKIIRATATQQQYIKDKYEI